MLKTTSLRSASSRGDAAHSTPRASSGSAFARERVVAVSA